MKQQQQQQQHLQTLIQLLTKQDLKALLSHYQDSSESENTAQLGFLYQQAQKNPSGYAFYQQLATAFIENKGLPTPVIARINNAATLSFFTPALQSKDYSDRTDQQQRNILHYLLAANPSSADESLPPFNYLRSMMLFESNEVLQRALCQRDQQNLTPVERYLAFNQNMSPLPAHEFTAFLALIEIQSKKQSVDHNNYKPLLNAVKKLCANQSLVFDPQLPRLQLVATYYSKPLSQINTGKT